MTDRRGPRFVLAAILLATAVLGARGIRNEGSAMLTGDMARYLMNGVFFRDLVADGGVTSPQDSMHYAERYYARYPALSLGHHPPLLSITIALFYSVFGVSVFSARLVALTFFVIAAWGVHAIANRLYGWQAAAWAALLFVTNEAALRFGQYALSEMPMVALVVCAVNALLLYCERSERKHFTWFVICAAASLYAKQLAIFMFPVYGAILVARLGWRSLMRRHVLALTGLGIVLVAPIAVLTLASAPTNVNLAAFNVVRLATGSRQVSTSSLIGRIIDGHLSLPALLAVVAGVVVSAVRRDSRVALGLGWALAVIGGTLVFAGGFEPVRYSFVAMPAYVLLASGLSSSRSSASLRWAGTAVLASVLIWQVWLVRNVQPLGAGGYELAAEFVAAESQQPVILFDSSLDTGYFMFFVRKHDPASRLVVLRADKLLTTREMGPQGFGSRVERGEDVYELLQRFGVQHVVVEERRAGPAALRLLHEELATDRFREVRRFPIESRDLQARDLDLVIYEYTDARPADPNAELEIDLPLANREIRLRIGDLVRQRHGGHYR
jgi:hypothetical protein